LHQKAGCNVFLTMPYSAKNAVVHSFLHGVFCARG